MADEKLLPTIELPCDRFPCTEKNRPEPLKHRWVPLMHREMVVNHYTESRNMTLSDLRAVLECLGPIDLRKVWPYAAEACPVKQIADLRERATAAEARAEQAERDNARLQELCALAVKHLERIGATSGSVADRAQTAAEIHESEVSRLRAKCERLEAELAEERREHDISRAECVAAEKRTQALEAVRGAASDYVRRVWDGNADDDEIGAWENALRNALEACDHHAAPQPEKPPQTFAAAVAAAAPPINEDDERIVAEAVARKMPAADRAGPDVGTLVERISKLELRVYRLEANSGKC